MFVNWCVMLFLAPNIHYWLQLTLIWTLVSMPLVFCSWFWGLLIFLIFIIITFPCPFAESGRCLLPFITSYNVVIYVVFYFWLSRSSFLYWYFFKWFFFLAIQAKKMWFDFFSIFSKSYILSKAFFLKRLIEDINWLPCFNFIPISYCKLFPIIYCPFYVSSLFS